MKGWIIKFVSIYIHKGDVMKYIETESVELKRTLNDTFEKEVVAFLNSHDGSIYIGGWR